jgi:hypothetical protein
MKKYLALLAFLVCATLKGFAQTTGGDEDRPRTTVEKPSRDFLMLKFNYNGWGNMPDSIKTKGLSRGFNASISYDFPIKKSHFSFAAGLGIGVSNIFLDDQVIRVSDTGSLGQARFVKDTGDVYKRYKLTTAYLEMPLELRFFGNNQNRNKGFKAAIGATVGMNIGAHTKGVTSAGGTKIIEKESTRRFMQQWSFAATARIGYGNFSLFGSYNLTPIFKDNLGPAVVPYSVGLCITGL